MTNFYMKFYGMLSFDQRSKVKIVFLRRNRFKIVLVSCNKLKSSLFNSVNNSKYDCGRMRLTVSQTEVSGLRSPSASGLCYSQDCFQIEKMHYWPDIENRREVHSVEMQIHADAMKCLRETMPCGDSDVKTRSCCR